jgi:hypothetical protein
VKQEEVSLDAFNKTIFGMVYEGIEGVEKSLA